MSKEEDREIKTAVVRQGEIITAKEQAPYKGVSSTFSELGICAQCNNLEAFETQYGQKYAQCSGFNRMGGPMILRSNDPIITCTCYWNRSFVRIRDMIGMATMIDSKRKIGFFDEDDDYEPCEIDNF
jgi:hypothetical protein